MAFMGLFLVFMALILTVLGVSAAIAFICFAVSGVIMLIKRKNHKGEGKVKKPWYVITMRVIGVLATIPLVLAATIVIYVLIVDGIDKRTNLARAVMNYDYTRVEHILQDGADPDVRDPYGRTLLMCVTDHEAYTDPETGMRYENLHGLDLSTDEDDLRMMELLITYGADINAEVTDCGYENIHTHGSIYENSDHYCGNTALTYAVRYRSPDIVEFMIDNGADVNHANNCGFTPILMCADMRSDDDGGIEIAELLFEAGADPYAVTNYNQDILWLIHRRGNGGYHTISELTELIEIAPLTYGFYVEDK